MSQGLNLTQNTRLSQVLAPQMRQGLDMLQMTALELRAELQHQMEQNPLIEDVTSSLERPISEALPEEHMSGEVSERELDFTADGQSAQQMLMTDDADRDYFLQNMENFQSTSENGTIDPDLPTRRQQMFDRQVKRETLQEHLAQQISLSSIPKEDRDLAAMLVADIDDNGYFTGSVPDIMMVQQVDEPRILATLRKISTFDPIGCGGRDLRECLLFQMEKLEDSPWEDEVRALVDRHLADVASHRVSAICADLHVTPSDYEKILKELRTRLVPKPGSGFTPKSEPDIYVRPEVFLLKNRDGKWTVRVSERDIPEIRISKRYLRMLEDPNCPVETKSYIRERIRAAETLIESIDKRQETIRRIAQAIVDMQTDVFDKKSLSALHPLTQDQIARQIGVHNATVSRTVDRKYMSTPLGLVRLGDFFVAGLSTSSGESISNAAVKDRIRQLIDAEEKRKPLSDEKISQLLKEAGISCARRTVTKYREAMGIPGTSERKS